MHSRHVAILKSQNVLMFYKSICGVIRVHDSIMEISPIRMETENYISNMLLQLNAKSLHIFLTMEC